MQLNATNSFICGSGTNIAIGSGGVLTYSTVNSNPTAVAGTTAYSSAAAQVFRAAG